MGKLRDDISIKDILLFLAAGGALIAAIVAPNAVQAFKFLLKDKNKISFRKFSQSRVKLYVDRLQKQDLIKRTRSKNQFKFILTEKGIKTIAKYDIAEMKLNQQKRWDGKWQVVIFDIPENKKKARDALREKFLYLGMRQLQKSVFIYPFDCKKEIDFVADFFGVGEDILYLEARINDIDSELRKLFDL